jgi:hypothetical protein
VNWAILSGATPVDRGGKSDYEVDDTRVQGRRLILLHAKRKGTKLNSDAPAWRRDLAKSKTASNNRNPAS